MITSSSGSQIPASHLLVETDDSSWPSNADRTLRLRVTPKVPGTFTIKLRGWICASGYSNVSRTGGPTTDQQGWQAQLLTVTVTPLSISGQVIHSDGGIIHGVEVTASGPVTKKATTDWKGKYTIADLAPGTYTVSPSLQGYTFSPSSRSVALPPNATGRNFIGYCQASPSVGISAPDYYTPGTPFDITVYLKNNGSSTAGDAYLDISFPENPTISVVSQSSGWNAVDTFDVGYYPLNTAGGGTTTAIHKLVSGYKAGISSGEERWIKVRITSSGGTVNIRYRGTIGDQRTPTSGTKDQQGWYVTEASITEIEYEQYNVSYGSGVSPNSVLLYEKKTITLIVTNTGSNTIPNLGIGLDIHDPSGKKVENTETVHVDPETGKIGRIDFNYTPSGLNPGESRTFEANYIFGTSVVGDDYQPGEYTFKYYAWAGGMPGDSGAEPIGELQVEPVVIEQTDYPAIEIPILMYHKVDEDSPSEYWVTVDNFHAQMELLHNLGYESITYDELRNYMLYGDALPAKPVIINLDDAYQNAYTKAKPILDEFGFIGVVNVPTGYIGNTKLDRQNNSWDPPEYVIRETNMLIWPELDALRDAGWSIQSHSVNHLDMTTLTDAQIRAEIIESRDTIQDKLNEQPQYFCYPYGIYNSRIKQILQEEGYLGAVSVVSGIENTSTANLYELKRIYIRGTDTLDDFWGYLGSSPRPRILNVPYYNQFDANWCWAASLSMILRYYGYERKPWEIAADFNKPKTGFWAGLNGFDTYFIIENYLEQWYDGGSNDAWKGETFYAFDGLEALVNRMKEVLSQGHPVWLSCWDAAHAIVAVGFDGNADSDHVFIHDPSGAITDPQNGSQVIYHKYTWQEFKDAIDQELISPLGEVVALYAQTSALSGHSTKASIEIAPFMLTFYNGMGGELQFDWDGSEPYEGYRYEPSANAAGWYSQDTDSKYHNYGFNARACRKTPLKSWVLGLPSSLPGLYNYTKKQSRKG